MISQSDDSRNAVQMSAVNLCNHLLLRIGESEKHYGVIVVFCIIVKDMQETICAWAKLMRKSLKYVIIIWI